MQEYTGFPEFSSHNSDFSREISVKISNFHENPGSTFSRIPGNFGRQNPGKCRNIRVSQNSRAKIQIFPGNFRQNLEFSRNFGVICHEIPGNVGRQRPGKCRNIRVSPFFGGKNHNFPGNFGRPVEISRKSGLIPQACTFMNIRVSRSPQAPILDPKKDPQKFICT